VKSAEFLNKKIATNKKIHIWTSLSERTGALVVTLTMLLCLINCRFIIIIIIIIIITKLLHMLTLRSNIAVITNDCRGGGGGMCSAWRWQCAAFVTSSMKRLG